MGASTATAWATAPLTKARTRERPPSVRVLTYHRFGDGLRDPWCVSAQVFESQVRFLAEHKLAVSLDDVLRFAKGEIALPDGAALITTDDGFSSVATIAAPILKRYKVPSVAFVTTGLIGALGVEANDPYMTWEQLAALPDSGVTIGSHAHEHRSLGKLSLDDARREGEHSKLLIKQNLGIDIDTFAYPYGMRQDETRDTRRVLGELGYTSIFIARHGTIHPGTDVLRLPRVKVEGGEPVWTFPLLCAGAMDAWKYIDDTLWVLQRPER